MSLNSVLVNLTGGSSKAKGAMDALGVSAWDSKGNFIGLTETLKILKEKLAKCTQEQRTNFESAIGGKTQLDPRVNDLIDKLSNLIDWFSNLDEGTQQTILNMGLFTLAAGASFWNSSTWTCGSLCSS